MPRLKTKPTSVNADALEAFRQRGVQSTLLDARLEFMEVEGTRRYVEGLVGQERCYPDMLPTQKSGRWSTTDPPLVNFPIACIAPDCPKPKPHPTTDRECSGWSARDIITLDKGEWGLKWDLDGVEARLFSAYAGDDEDIQAFREGLDLHTITCCRVYELPLPPDLRNPHTSPSCAAWRAQVGWEGKEDKRRVTSKNLRYGVLQYGINEKAASEIRDIEKLGLTRTQLFERAKRLLDSKPKYTAFKRLTWGQVIEQRETRTFLGRKRRFYPSRQEVDTWRRRGIPGDEAKSGLNHRIQGAVADIMNLTLIGILVDLYPEGTLHLNAHDGAFVGFPVSLRPEDVIPAVTPIIARVWDVEDHKVPITASGVLLRGGQSERVVFNV